MAIPKRINIKGEQLPGAISRTHGALRTIYRLALKTGKITFVDPERLFMYVRWEHGNSGDSPKIPISFPICGPSSFMGMLPEVGATGIFGFYMEGDTQKTKPFLIGYLPANLTDAIQYNEVKLQPDAIPNEDKNILQYRLRQLTIGDINISSPHGGGMFITSDVAIFDKAKDTILIRESDQSIIQTSISNFMFADGVSINAGRIIRPHYDIFDRNFKRIEGSCVCETHQSNFLVPFGERITSGSQYYSEYRIDVGELVDGVIDQNGINTPGAISISGTSESIISLIMGNYVGNDLSNKSKGNYAKILRPSMFNSPTDKDGQFNLVECTQFNGFDQVSTLGMAYALHSLKTGCFMGVDKEGHYYMYLPASMANPLGGGRSMSILANGNLKEIWGADTFEANSWDLSTKGGIKWNVKAHNDKLFNRSIDIKATSSIYIEAGGQDTEPVKVKVDGTEEIFNFAKQEKITGNALSIVSGTQFTDIAGNQRVKITGLKSEQIFGSASYQYQTDLSENITGISTEIVGDLKQGRYSKRKVTVMNNDELEILTGDRKETLTFGNRKTILQGAGSIEESITIGNKKVTINAGAYKVNITTAGNIILSTAAGTAKISSTLGAIIDGTLTLDLKAAKTSIGVGPPLIKGGVVTGGTPVGASHLDYMVGIPLQGSMTVEASR